MHLYNLTLQRSTGITHSVHGNFSGSSKLQEIVVSRGKTLELLRPDTNTGKVHTVLTGMTTTYICAFLDSIFLMLWLLLLHLPLNLFQFKL